MKNLAKILVLLLVIATLAACDTNTQNSDTPNTDPPTDVIEIGTGNTTFQFEAVDNNEETTIWFVSTNEETVGAALLEVGLIEGDVSAFGLFVSKVNGLVADWDVNQSWWAFYIDSEMSMYGVDDVEINVESVYAFIYTIG